MAAVQVSPSLRALLPPAVSGYEMALGSSLSPAVRRATEVRAGRAAAAAALADVGTDRHVGRHPDRRPAWPQGAVGSIAHCNHLAVAVAAPVSAFVALGVDVEDLDDVGEELREVVLTPVERTVFAARSAAFLGIVFSLKESAFKCWSPLLGVALEWGDIEVGVHADEGAFTADVVGPYARLGPPTVTGRYAVRDAHVLSAGWIGRD